MRVLLILQIFIQATTSLKFTKEVVYKCSECVCYSRVFHYGTIEKMDCVNTKLSELPYLPKPLLVEVCDMSGTPYCQGYENEDHEPGDSQYEFVVCQGGIFIIFYQSLFYPF